MTDPNRAPRRLSSPAKFGFALGELSLSTCLTALTMVYAGYFLTQEAGLRPVLAGLVPLVGPVLAAILATAAVLAADPERSWISSSCPAIVSYVRHYHPDLSDALLPVVSPMVACAKALRRSELWEPASWPEESELPSAACIVRDHIGLEADLDTIEAARQKDLEATLWRPGGSQE